MAVLAAGLLGMSVSHPAFADERSDARRHFRTGMDLIGQQRFADGIAELEAAYAILPHPNVLYNIARAYNAMGNTERAIEYLRRYLQNDVADRADVEAIVARLEARVRQQPATAAQTATNATPTTPTPGSTGGTTITLPTSGGSAAQADAIRAAAAQMLRLADAADGAHGSTSGGASLPASPSGPGGHEGLGAAAGTETYEEQVVTASRAAQSPLDAPNATGVITAQDIRLSGLTTVPELLRRVAGVDVMQLDSGDFDVSIRGFNQRLSNKVLVLIDGRSINLDFLGITLWTAVFPAVEEIERIEVIRGPGSALYGADAFTGIVNIITRPPGESRTQISLGGGSGQQMRGVMLMSGREGSLAYRASIQYEQRATYDRQIGDQDHTYRYVTPSGDLGFQTPRFMLDVSDRFARDVVLRAGIGGSVAGTEFFTPTGILRRFWSQSTFVQPYIQLDAGGFTGRVYWNHFQADAGPIIVPVGGNDLRAQVQQDVVDVDLQYSARQQLGIVTNTVQAGLGGRMKYISWNYLDADHTLFLFSGFLQDTLRIGPRFEAVASARLDRHPVLDNVIASPRAALIFHPSDRRAIRLSGGTAFRTPTLIELYFDLLYPTPVPGVTVFGAGSEVNRALSGTPRLLPETAVSADLGFQDQTWDRFQYEINGFITQGSNVINLSPVITDPLPGSAGAAGPVNIGTRYYANDPGSTYVAGLEVGARLSPVDGLDFYGNYTLAYTWHDAVSPLAATPDHAADQRTPLHKFNLGVQMRFRFGLEFEAFVHYVSATTWVEPVLDQQGSRDVAFGLSDYVVVNARVGYRLLGDRLNLGVVGTNLASPPGSEHLEHPFGAAIGLRVMGTASYRF